jgi:glycosyltransferase involved in cell wall biosynthesis
MAGIFIPEQCGALSRAGVKTGLIFSRFEGLRNLSWRRLHCGVPGFVHTNDPVPTWGFATWSPPGLNRIIPSLVDRTLSKSYERYCAGQGRPDILHAHVALQSGPTVLRIARATGLEYIVTEHSSEILNADPSSGVAQRARRIYAEARCVIAVSSALERRIRDICPEARIRVIGNMVPDYVFRLRASKPPVSDGLKLLTLSNLQASKRVDRVIEAIAGLPSHLGRRVTLDVVGDGPEQARLQGLARELGVAARFHGELARERAMEMLAASDLLVHASAFETFGIVLAEAGALGVPVVATRCGGPEDIVASCSGLLVDVDDIRSLRGAVQSVLENLECWRSKAVAMSERAFELFHESKVAAAIARIYEST